MPCWEVRTTYLDAPAANIDIMRKALEALGLKTNIRGRMIEVENDWGSGYWADGRLIFNGEGTLGFDASGLRREYSKETIKHTAKKQGWKLRFKKNGQIEAVKRSFA